MAAQPIIHGDDHVKALIRAWSRAREERARAFEERHAAQAAADRAVLVATLCAANASRLQVRNATLRRYLLGMSIAFLALFVFLVATRG